MDDELSQETIRGFKKIISDLAVEEFKNLMNKYGIETVYDCEVTSAYFKVAEASGAYDQYVSVKIPGNNSVIDGVRNLSGELLEVGNYVRLYAPRNNMSNGYIGVKCKS